MSMFFLLLVLPRTAKAAGDVILHYNSIHALMQLKCGHATAFHVKLYDNCSVLFFLNIEELTSLFYQGTVL